MTSIEARANTWICGNDTGMSSKAIWAHMQGVGGDLSSYPSDGGDLGRCLRLLALIPEWGPRIGEMATVSAYWAALVANWPELKALHAQDEADKSGRPSRTYKRMKEILDPIEDADPRVVRLGSGMSLCFGR